MDNKNLIESHKKNLIIGFEKIQEGVIVDWLHGDQETNSFNWLAHFEKDKEQMNKLIESFEFLRKCKETQDNSQITPEIKMFSNLGYIPRDSEFTYPMNCFLYWYIKKHCPQAVINVAADGSIYGQIKNEYNKNNVCLNAHMDIIDVDRNYKDRIWYGSYGANGAYNYKQKDNKLLLKRENPRMPLGADDGKGVATILNVLANYDAKTMPNLTFFISTVEENALYSMKNFVKKPENVLKLFPNDLNNLVFINLDSFEGKEIDLYTNQSLETKPLEQDLIDVHKKYVEEDLNEKSTQEACWHDPMSDAFCINMFAKRQLENDKTKQIKLPLLVSLAPSSEKPHCIDETIDVIEFGKFQKYMQKTLLPYLSNYIQRKLTDEELWKLHEDEIKKDIELKKARIGILEEELENCKNDKSKGL